MTLWVARAGRYGERESFAFENNLVVVGWDKEPRPTAGALDGHLSRGESEDGQDLGIPVMGIRSTFSEGRSGGAAIEDATTVAFGRIAEDYQYASDAPPGARHQRPVEWIDTDIARSKLDTDLRFSLGGAMTVFSVQRNKAEARIRALLEGKPMPDAAVLPQTN